LVCHVLSYAEFASHPPSARADRTERTRARYFAPAFLVPCRSGGLEDLGAPIYYLDERPTERHAGR
jgi:hypothetical protein